MPIVNAFGFLNQSRYLPDRPDLNRSFAGSPSGSMASRLANHFMEQIVAKSDVGIDLHSAPLTLESKLLPGFLRDSAEEIDVPVLLYEAGEALRFEELSARSGLSGRLKFRSTQHLMDLS